jgi:Uma2 family endonuclease
VQWFPVEGSPLICHAPDPMVVFGRPKGRRKAYLQWVEGNIPPQVVFEVGPSAFRYQKLMRKFQFYEHYGVEEYYHNDPDRTDLRAWRRVGQTLEEIPHLVGWTSPLLGIGFAVEANELQIIRPDRPLQELMEQTKRYQQARELAEKRAERLAAQLRALGVDPEAEPPQP